MPCRGFRDHRARVSNVDTSDRDMIRPLITLGIAVAPGPSSPGATVLPFSEMGWTLLLLTGACYRLTRLIARDQFPPLLKARIWIEVRYGTESWQAYLSQCSFCVSWYVATVLVLATDRIVPHGLPLPVYWVLTASALTGLIASWEPAQ